LLRLTSHEIRVWADEQGFPDMLFAELDYRLVRILEALYRDDFLAKRLYIKCGTAINKLYLGETSRLSIDLDFNHVGPKGEVLKERHDVRERIVELLKKQDSSYVTHSKHRYEQTTIKAKYKAVAGPIRNFKIEISHIERFPIVSPVQRQVRTPDGLADVTTYALEELTATKLRALLERFKGRDVYDLYFISQLKTNPAVTRKMFLYYFYRSSKVFNPKIHYRNLTKRYTGGKYADDVSAFVKPTVQFHLETAAQEVITRYSFINELDARDTDFLKLAGMLLGKKVPKESVSRLEKVEKPFKLLFDDMNISQEALDMSTDEIKLYRKKKREQKDSRK